MNRYIGTDLCETLRLEYQTRVGSLCLSEFTLDEEEMQALLSVVQPRLLLQSFNDVKNQLQRLRDQLVFCTQEEIVQRTKVAISKVVSDDARFRSHRADAQEHDYSMTYQEERLARRKARYDAKVVA